MKIPRINKSITLKKRDKCNKTIKDTHFVGVRDQREGMKKSEQTMT